MQESPEVEAARSMRRDWWAWEADKTATPRHPGMLEMATQEKSKSRSLTLKTTSAHTDLCGTKLAP